MACPRPRPRGRAGIQVGPSQALPPAAAETSAPHAAPWASSSTPRLSVSGGKSASAAPGPAPGRALWGSEKQREVGRKHWAPHGHAGRPRADAFSEPKLASGGRRFREGGPGDRERGLSSAQALRSGASPNSDPDPMARGFLEQCSLKITSCPVQ